MEDIIARINALARKSKAEGLTPEETEEREALRKQYIAAVRNNLVAHLERTYVMDVNGQKRKLKKKDEK